MNYQSIPVKRFIVQNTKTGGEVEFSEFEEADSYLNRQRSESNYFEYRLLAEVDA